jgi:hypothetical protein
MRVEPGIETSCNGSGNCASRDNTLVTAPGYDNVTGLGRPGQISCLRWRNCKSSGVGLTRANRA